MFEDDIKKVDEWFENHTENYGTYHSDNCYSISQYDIEDFTDFLQEEFTDLCYIPCYIGTGDSVIWFFRDCLEEAKFN